MTTYLPLSPCINTALPDLNSFNLLVTQLLGDVGKDTPSTTDLPVEKLLNAAITTEKYCR